MKKLSFLIIIFFYINCVAAQVDNYALLDQTSNNKAADVNQTSIDGSSLNKDIEKMGNNETLVLYGVSTIKSDVPIKISNKENFTIKSSTGNEITILNSNLASEVIVIDSCSNITLEGFLAKHDAENMACSGNVLSIKNSKSVFIKNCKLNGSGFIGISIENNSKNIFIENCELFQNSGYGAKISSDSQNIRLIKCTIHDNQLSGIQLSGNGMNLSIINCKFYNNNSMINQSN